MKNTTSKASIKIPAPQVDQANNPPPPPRQTETPFWDGYTAFLAIVACLVVGVFAGRASNKPKPVDTTFYETRTASGEVLQSFSASTSGTNTVENEAWLKVDGHMQIYRGPLQLRPGDQVDIRFRTRYEVVDHQKRLSAMEEISGVMVSPKQCVDKSEQASIQNQLNRVGVLATNAYKKIYRAEPEYEAKIDYGDSNAVFTNAVATRGSTTNGNAYFIYTFR